MRTRFGALCEAVIEGGWLLAIAAVPLCFNLYSHRVFEPDKVAVLRTIATVMAVASLGHFLDAWRRGHRGEEALTWRTPLVVPSMVVAASYLLATALSIVPRASLWGSYQRLQGTYTTLSYLVVFAGLLGHLRRRSQLERIVSLLVLTSLPVSLYGLLQHDGLDPLPWGGDTTFRVTAHMGNAIFLGAYLIMVVPLTAARVLRYAGWAAELRGRRGRAPFWAGTAVLLVAEVVTWALGGFGAGLAVGLAAIVLLGVATVRTQQPAGASLLLGAHLLILSAQLVCIVFTQSRGPLLGLGAGMVFFLLLYLASLRRRALSRMVVGLGVVALGVLVLLNVPGSPLAAFRQVPYVGRLGRLLETEADTGRVRVLIWEGVAEMLTADPARALLGYGPESMYVAYNRYYQPELAHWEERNRSPDRAHNETFDVLATTGVVGLGAAALLWGAVCYHGLRFIGLLAGAKDRARFLLLAATGSASGVLVPLALDGSLRFTGVGLPLGLLGGVGLYVAHAAWAPPRGGAVTRREAPEDVLLLCALLGALVAHLVEIDVGIAITATRTYGWVYAALLVVLGERLVHRDHAPDAEAGARARTGGGSRAERTEPAARATQPGAALGAGVGLLLAVLAWDWTTNPLGLESPFRVLATSLTTLAAVGRPQVISPGPLLIALTVVLLGSLFTVGYGFEERGGRRTGDGSAHALGWYGLAAVGLGGAYSLAHAAALAGGVAPFDLPYGFYGMLAVAWALLAGALAPWRAAERPRSLLAPLATGGLLALGLLFVFEWNLRPVRADVIFKEGQRYDAAQEWDKAAFAYRLAHQTAPVEDYYLLYYGRAVVELASRQADEEVRDLYYDEALAALQRARALNPLNTDHAANIARLYRRWAHATSDPATAEARRQQALGHYARAAELSPRNVQLLNEWALVHYDGGELEDAAALLERSLAIDGRYYQTYILVGELHHVQGRYREASVAFREASSLAEDSVQAWAGLGSSYAGLEQWEEAAVAYRRAVQLDPQAVGVWTQLGGVYVRLGEGSAALAAYAKALEGGAVDVRVLRSTAELALEMGRLPEAEAALQRLADGYPDDYEAQRALAEGYARLGRSEEALHHARRAVELAPTGQAQAARELVAELSRASAAGGKEGGS